MILIAHKQLFKICDLLFQFLVLLNQQYLRLKLIDILTSLLYCHRLATLCRDHLIQNEIHLAYLLPFISNNRLLV